MSQTTTTNSQSKGEQQYWRSLDQLQETPAFQEQLHREFQDGVGEAPTGLSRRNFLSVVAASVALASMTGCRKPKQKILPFGKRPEFMTPGVANHYATSHVHGGYGIGTLVKSSDGRPTKVEGNPLHPSSMGSATHLMQAEVLNLYDPARSTHPLHNGEQTDLHAFDAFLDKELEGYAANQGKGLAVLMEPTSSPTAASLLAKLQKKFPQASSHSYAPVNQDLELQAGMLAFVKKPLRPQYQLQQADRIVSFDCDFMGQDGDVLRNSRDFAKRRKINEDITLGSQDPSRLYVIEGFHSLTGSNADHRFRVPQSQIGDAVMALAAELAQKHGIDMRGLDFQKHAARASDFTYNGKSWITHLAADLAENPGKSCLMVGPRLPAEVQGVLHYLNFCLKNEGKTVTYRQFPKGLDTPQATSLAMLAQAMDSGEVKTLLILGANPVYTAPADLGFADKLGKVGTVIHLGQFVDETASLCAWHVNQAHDLEAWGDVRGYDGSASIIQPLIAPLHHGISNLDLLARLAGVESKSGYDNLQSYWRKNALKGDQDFESWWRRCLHDGLVPNTASKDESSKAFNIKKLKSIVADYKPATAPSKGSLELQFRPSYTVHDGRYSNNAWLMELPDPMTKLTWDNAAITSLKTCQELGVKNGDMLELSHGGQKLSLPVWVLPGHADFSFTLSFGFGRDLGEQHRVAKKAGFNTYALRTTSAMACAQGATATATGQSYELATTQDHGSMEGRPLVREADLDSYRKDTDFAPQMSPLAKAAAVETLVDPKHPKTEADLNKSLWSSKDLPPQWRYEENKDSYQWGMVIDLNSCTGCSSCVAACVSENNIPTVGKEQVMTGREMHWNRLDRYFKVPRTGGNGIPGFRAVPEDENPQVVHQMVPCQQCENAPCEVVCPVAATTHSPEGLNDMAYNRCIGTRYCGNNCPYKVRKFNYLDFHQNTTETTKMAANPDVTVRHRGVMEKCTYCVQRINVAKINARVDGRKLADGELTTACAQSCPTEAITFGNINDPNSKVAKLRSSDLNYAMLSELNTRPRTTYLAKIRNPNPKLS